ncbi:hypothetical protein KL925_000934 [Ogataea polymorpha]|uniref:Uncharacterized protein n=2 Tax=Ogataea polymorpha TaxID=460523 RepID=A0A9P8PDL5_9ASCO|nr:hypothetical protein KL937_004411 [Ogataea polymorpha]KAG7896757.1 hypothetical protein KL908_000159 [Ogataea polymorpha]KAG7903440.1 hypothetical protein KL935_000972 [Ogataea polymorpha]KAG7911955.1 hypothetical protein KL906_000159 [Ogataea polymorpha]KAG7920280.1 hypothetical protein KL927_000960 [Ogataea polymorpha]
MNQESYLNSLISNTKIRDKGNASESLNSSPLHSSSIYHQQGNLGSSMDSSSSFFQYQNMNHSGAIINPLLKTLEFIGAKSPDTPSAASVMYKLRKLINAEKKVLKRRHEFLGGVSHWVNVLSNPENKRLLVEFSRIAELQGRLDEEMIRKKENINLQLYHVSQRESKSAELKLKRARTFKQLRDQERKIGDNHNTCLSREALEELNISIEVVDEQLIKSINTSLQGSLVDYVLSMQSVSSDIKEGCNEFFEYLNADSIYNCRKSYLLDDSSDKIQYLGSRETSENKENQYKGRAESVKPAGGNKKKYLNLTNLTGPTEVRASTEHLTGHELKEELGTLQTQPLKCPDCGSQLKNEHTQHSSVCSYSKQGLNDPPGSSQSLAMPGRLGIRIPSVLKSRAGEGW